MSSGKYSSIHYQSYLELDKVLDAQHPRSAEFEENAAHEEMLFIIVHQVYELWFKQIIHELDSVKTMFLAKSLDEKNIGIAVGRLERVTKIQQLMIEQITIMETMTPLDFLDFRSYLFPASGFQSFQFRKVEVLLGLRHEARITYNNQPYTSAFSKQMGEELRKLESEGSLFELVEDWLERTPFLDFGEFNFLSHYEKAVERMLKKEKAAIQASPILNEEEKDLRIQALGSTDTYYQNILSKERHEEIRQSGELRLSHKASVAALLIHLYRDQPLLHLPYMLLVKLVDMDEYFTSWRYRHAQMVLRMLGRKMGTGGSSGHDYLRKTAREHHIFRDLHNISTLLIPRSELPALPPKIVQELGFHFTKTNIDKA